MTNTVFSSLGLLLFAAISSDPAFAQIAPDWTGYYTMAARKDLAGTPFKQDAPGEELNKLIIPHLQPWAKARMEATDGVADDTGQVCLPDGIFRYPSMAGRFVWLAERDRIVMVFGDINTAGVRRIYLNRPHPKNPNPSWNGDSIGRWEGDTLVVDTSGSMAFGSGGVSKLEYARRLAGALGHLALLQGDAVGLACVAGGMWSTSTRSVASSGVRPVTAR